MTSSPTILPYRHRLTFTPRPLNPNPPPPPPGIERVFIPSPHGRLEVLQSLPTASTAGHGSLNTTTTTTSNIPLLFLHGGFGTASCFEYLLPYFSGHSKETPLHCAQHPSFSLSMRGHGNSYPMGFMKLVLGTGLRDLCEDVAAAASYIKATTGSSSLILFGHSSGGGLVQHIVSRDSLACIGVRVIGLSTLAGIPCFGSWRVYLNWLLLDPWFVLRMYWHLMHPRSPLSSTKLVRAAFFSKELPEEAVVEFEKVMPEYESMQWAYRMMLPGFIKTEAVVANLTKNPDLDSSPSQILVVSGGKDMLMGVTLMERMAAVYRESWALFLRKSTMAEAGDIVESMADKKVAFLNVEGSGHNVMKDVYWKVCAEGLSEWLKGFEG